MGTNPNGNGGDDHPRLTTAGTATTTSKTSDGAPPKGALMLGGGTVRELVFGMGCGVLYGVTSPLIGQPFDTVKTKMQAQRSYAAGGMFKTFATVIQKEGFLALYRGLLPPLIGSGIYRSVQFGVYNSVWTLMKDSRLAQKEIPFSGGLEMRVIMAGIIASSARSVIETPLELIKVRRQVGEPWKVTELFKGFGVSWLRTVGLMTTFFILVDSAVRHIPDVINTPLIGPFIKGGVCATLSWWVIWPFETLKSQVQGNTPGPQGLWPRFLYVLRTGGVAGLFRGIVPGSSRSLIANGVSMFVFTQCQQLRERYLEAETAKQQRSSS
ncbi:Mitochondrial carrier [Balamuthia mandrillaris]